jgi:hypothetical protein
MRAPGRDCRIGFRKRRRDERQVGIALEPDDGAAVGGNVGDVSEQVSVFSRRQTASPATAA